MPHSQSWDSGLGVNANPYDRYLAEENVDYIADEIELPEPPPLPSVEYLLGKRPVNLRKRASQTLKDEIMRKAAAMGNEEAGGNSDDSDGQGSVGSAGRKHRRKKASKRKKKKGREEDAVNADGNKWTYNKHLLPQSSPPRSRKVGIERYPTPIPNQPGIKISATGKAIAQKLDFESAFDELSKDLEALAGSPSSLSPLDSPSPKSPISSVEASPIHKAGNLPRPARPAPMPPISGSKRGAPKLQPHKQNKQGVKNVITNANTKDVQEVKPSRISPIFKIASGRNKMQQKKTPAHSGKEKETQEIVNLAKKSPADFMSALTNAISSSPKQPRVMRQVGRTDSSSPLESSSPTMQELEKEISEIESLLNSAASDNLKRPPSPEFVRGTNDTDDLSESETESSEYTSSSESSSSDSDSSSDSSEEDGELKRPLTPKRPIMARNIGMSAGRRRGMRFNRFNRFPRLLRKKPVHLETIHEVPEEKIYSGVS